MEAVDCPAQAIEKLLKNYTLGRNVSAILVDMHAEATSEKLAMGYFLDGRVSAVAGTHTHVPTADARILPKGTAYITDVGMCGDYESVLGFEVEEPVNRLNRRYTGGRLVPSKGPGTLFGIAVETDDATGLAKQSNKSGFRAGNVIADAVKTFSQVNSRTVANPALLIFSSLSGLFINSTIFAAASDGNAGQRTAFSPSLRKSDTPG